MPRLKLLLLTITLIALFLFGCVPTGAPAAAMHKTPYKKSIPIVYDFNERNCIDIQPALEQTRRQYPKFYVKLVDLNQERPSHETLSRMKLVPYSPVRAVLTPSFQFYRDGIFERSTEGTRMTSDEVLAMVKEYFADM